MIAANNYAAFRYAARDGYIAVLDKLIALVAPDQLQQMIAARGYEAFSYAAMEGHIAVLNKLIALAPAANPKNTELEELKDW